MKSLCISALLLLAALCATAQAVTVHALSYNDIKTKGYVVFTHTTKSYSVVTVSNQPGKTFTLESGDYRLEPGHTYTGEWTKHGKKIKVHALAVGYYAFNKKTRTTTVTFKVVGEGITESETDTVVTQAVPKPKKPCTRTVFDGKTLICQDKE